VVLSCDIAVYVIRGMEERGRGMMAEDDASIEIPDAGGSRSPNGQHVFSTQVGGVPLFTRDGAWNPVLAIEVIAEGSMIRHAGGAWQAAGWHLRARGVPSDAAITNGKVR
jgi:hypothetical protein